MLHLPSSPAGEGRTASCIQVWGSLWLSSLTCFHFPLPGPQFLVPDSGTLAELDKREQITCTAKSVEHMLHPSLSLTVHRHI